MEYNFPEWYSELINAVSKFQKLVGNADLSDVPIDVRDIIYNAQSTMTHELAELIILKYNDRLPNLYEAQEKA